MQLESDIAVFWCSHYACSNWSASIAQLWFSLFGFIVSYLLSVVISQSSHTLNFSSSTFPANPRAASLGSCTHPQSQSLSISQSHPKHQDQEWENGVPEGNVACWLQKQEQHVEARRTCPHHHYKLKTRVIINRKRNSSDKKIGESILLHIKSIQGILC